MPPCRPCHLCQPSSPPDPACPISLFPLPRSYNVHPIAHSLERFSNRRMMMVIRRAVGSACFFAESCVATAAFALVATCAAGRPCGLPRLFPPLQLVVCTAVFTLVAGGGYCLFGSATNANIL